MKQDHTRAEIERGAALFNQIAERLLAALPEPSPAVRLDDITHILNRNANDPGSVAIIEEGVAGDRVSLFLDDAGEIAMPNPVVADAYGNFPRTFVSPHGSLTIRIDSPVHKMSKRTE